MHHAFRTSLGALAATFLIVSGCGDDDDGPDQNTGGTVESGGGSPNQGGSGGKGGSGGQSGGTGGTVSSGGASGGSSAGAGGQAEGLECEVLGRLCHEADTGTGPAHECHEIGHVGDAAACKEHFGECVSVCVDGGGDGAGGAGGASAGGASGAGGAAPTESPYCVALGRLCHDADDGNGPAHACHEVGHVGEAAACEARFATCAVLCLAAGEGNGQGGSSGSGGASGGGVSGGGNGGAGG